MGCSWKFHPQHFLPFNSKCVTFDGAQCHDNTEAGHQTQKSSERRANMLFAPEEKGQGLVEYAIILALIAIVVIAVMRLLGPKIGNTFSTIASSLP
jgi:pilus assembly protein Flp/PilA